MLLVDGGEHRFTIPVQHHSRSASYSDIRFSENLYRDLGRFTRTLMQSTREFPCSPAALQLLNDTFPDPTAPDLPFVDAFERMAESLFSMLRGRTELLRSSAIGPRGQGPAAEYIADLVEAVGGDVYVNPIGGMSLYDDNSFARRGIRLCFLQSRIAAATFDDPREACLSVLHHVARYSPTELNSRLPKFDLLDPTAR